MREREGDGNKLRGENQPVLGEENSELFLKSSHALGK
jgi:hypothetical protein